MHKKNLTRVKIVTISPAHHIKFIYMELVMIVAVSVIGLFVLPYLYVATQSVEAR